jgi:hypothetical protein
MNERVSTPLDPQEQTDLDNAWRHFEAGTPFEPDLAQRIRERSEKLTREIFQKFGYIDVDQLLRDDET